VITDTLSITYAGKPSTFRGELAITKKGSYEVIVYAYDPLTGNTGVDKTNFTAY
jgi:hypothetical protein